MAAIKRNLVLVLSAVIALALMGFGGYYLYAANEKNSLIDNEINQAKAEIDRLLNLDPTPNQSNLNNARREFERLNAFISEAKKQFPPTGLPPAALNNQSFKSLLQTTIDDLHKQASRVGIKVSPDYYFTFDNQRLAMVFAPESLRPLAERLHEVRSVALVLFKSRINRLVSMRRAAVNGERSGNAPLVGSDYLNSQPKNHPDTSMVGWPYEVTFDCFTAELGQVLEGLQRADFGIVVKSVATEPVLEPGQGGPRRTNAPATTLTVINERLLRATLRLEVIKPGSEGGFEGRGDRGPGRGRP